MTGVFQRAAMIGCALSLSTTALAEGTAPNCPIVLADGQTSVRQLAGKVVYLDFWASWCGACLASFPFMERMQQDLGPKGLQIIAVNMDQKPADAQRFLSRHHVTFPVALGQNDACAKKFGVNAMPTTFIVDRRGTIRASHSSFRPSDGAALRAIVERLLTEPAHS